MLHFSFLIYFNKKITKNRKWKKLCIICTSNWKWKTSSQIKWAINAVPGSSNEWAVLKPNNQSVNDRSKLTTSGHDNGRAGIDKLATVVFEPTGCKILFHKWLATRACPHCEKWKQSGAKNCLLACPFWNCQICSRSLQICSLSLVE